MFVYRRSLLDEVDTNLICHVTLGGVSAWRVKFVITVTVIAHKQQLTEFNKLAHLLAVFRQRKRL